MGKILEKLMKNTGKMRKILEKFMKKYWKNAKKTEKVREIRQSKKVGTILIAKLNFLNFKCKLSLDVVIGIHVCSMGKNGWITMEIASIIKGNPISPVTVTIAVTVNTCRS